MEDEYRAEDFRLFFFLNFAFDPWYWRVLEWTRPRYTDRARLPPSVVVLFAEDLDF